MDGLLTRHGARTSHAAVVARQLGKACLVGCEAMQIDDATGRIGFGDRRLEPVATITLAGNSGTIYAGSLRTSDHVPTDLLQRLGALRGKAQRSIDVPGVPRGSTPSKKEKARA